MAEDRRREVEVGAGLQESRLNEEFIEGLKKHGPKVIYALAAVVLVVYGVNAYKNYRADQRDEALAQLDQVSDSPDNLLGVANASAQQAVSLTARLRAANALMDSARARVRHGVKPTEATAADMLSDAQVAEQYQKAAKEFQAVITAAQADEKKYLFVQSGRWGLATAKMSLGDNEHSKEIVQQYLATAEAKGLQSQVTMGQIRLERLENPVTPKLVSSDALPQPTLRPDAEAARETLGGNTVNEAGQAAWQKLLERTAERRKEDRKDWRPHGETDWLVPIRDGERIIAYAPLSSIMVGAVDERMVGLLQKELAGEDPDVLDEMELRIILENAGATEEQIAEKIADLRRRKAAVGPQAAPAGAENQAPKPKKKAAPDEAGSGG